jgi:hypothetical protein
MVAERIGATPAGRLFRPAMPEKSADPLPIGKPGR